MPLGIAVGVQHGQKVRREAAPGILDRKILLVVAHDRDQNFLGQLQKFRIERTQDRRRPFGQVDHGVEQRLVFAPARAGNGASGGVESLANLLFSLLATEDPGFLQRLDIWGSGAGNRDRSVGQNSMSARLVSGANAIELQRDDVAIEHGHQPAHRTHEALAGLAPVHVLRPVNGCDLFGQGLGQNFSGRAPLLPDYRGQVLALRSCDALQLGDLHAGFFCEGVRGRSGLAIFERNRDRWAGLFLDDLWLDGRNIRRQHRQAARRIEISQGTRGQQPFAVEELVQALAQFERRRVDHPRRNLFATDFE